MLFAPLTFLFVNWSAQPSGSSVGDATVGRYTLNGDGSGTATGFLHAVDNRNQIASFIKSDGTTTPGTNTTTAFVYDLAGNLVFDGMYLYQYGAWNRLVQVNKKGTLEWYRFPYAPGLGIFGALPINGSFRYFTTEGMNYPAACPGSDVGELVKHFTYDGVGRLFRTSSPVEAPADWEFEEVPGGPSSAPNPWFTRSERFIYDGVRRIQEIVTDPILADGEGNRVATMSFENDNRNGNGNGGGGSGGQASVLPTMSVFLSNEDGDVPLASSKMHHGDFPRVRV